MRDDNDCKVQPNEIERIGSLVLSILTYGGNDDLDVIINYGLIVMNTFVIWRNTSSIERERCRDYAVYGLCSLLFVVLFQIGLCLILKCTGVSIIWCALAGWILIKEFSFILLIDLCAILYYTLTAPFITTIAHVMAIFILGIPLRIFTEKRIDAKHSREQFSTLY